MPLPSRHILAAALLCAIAGPCPAAGFTQASLSSDRQRLTLVRASVARAAPRTAPDQQGFDAAKISADGRLAGWLALTPNCCTSYPLPTMLVIYRPGKVVRTIGNGRMIMDWAFVDHGTAVAYREGFPHGPDFADFTLQRIADGTVLARFRCEPRDSDQRTGTAPGAIEPALRVPDWVWAVTRECPAPVAADRP